MNLREALGDTPLLVGVRKNRIWVQETSWIEDEWVGGSKIVKPILSGSIKDRGTWQNYSIIATWLSDNLSALFPVTSWVVSSFCRLAIVPPENVTLVNMRDRYGSSKGQLKALNNSKEEYFKFKLNKGFGSELWVSSLPLGNILRFNEPECKPTKALPNTEEKVKVLRRRFKNRQSLWNKDDATRR